MAEKDSCDKDSLKNDALEVKQQFLKLNQPDSLGINTKKPKFPQYAVISKRTDSYKNWPKDLNIDPTTMIDAGLVFTGVGDSVRCYHCGGELRNWEVTDNPWEEHAKWYPTCPHVRLVKGQDYIDRVGRGEKPEKDDPIVPETKTATKMTDYQLLKTVAAQSCMECGFTEADVLKAIKLFQKNNNGSTEFKAADIAEIIIDLQEEPEGAEGCETTVFNCCKDGVCAEHQQQAVEDDPERIAKWYQENQRMKEKLMCKICPEKYSNVIFLPCGHMIICPRCASALIKCPQCRMGFKYTVTPRVG